MKTVIILFSFLLILGSCNKKFKHEGPVSPQTVSCELCDYADSISGTYRGFSDIDYHPDDSVTITLEHIFLNLGNNLDSTSMYFKVTKTFDSSSSPWISTVLLESKNGNIGLFYSTSSWSNNTSWGTMYVKEDSLYVNDYVNNNMGSIEIMDFKGKKL